MNLSLYALAIATSRLVEAFLSEAFISQFHAVLSAATSMDYASAHYVPLFWLRLPQFSVACKRVKVVHTQYLIPFKFDCQLLNDCPMLLANVLLGSAIEDNSMLKDRFTVPGMMASSLPKFGHLTNSNWFWSISLRLCMTTTFCLVLFMPLGILR